MNDRSKEQDSKKSKSNKFFWGCLIFVVNIIIIGFPFFMDYCIVGNKVYSNIDNSEWVSFLGSYVGAIFGSVATVAGIIITIKYTRKEAHKDREIAEVRLKEDRRLSHAPFIIESFSYEDDYSIESGTSLLIKKRTLAEEEAKELGFIAVSGYIILTNIGNGTALAPEIIDAKIHDNNNQDILNTVVEKDTFPITRAILKDNSIEIVVRLSSELLSERNKLSEFTLTFKLQYFDVMNYRYIQEVKIEYLNLNSTLNENTEKEDSKEPRYRAKKESLETIAINIEPKNISKNIIER